MDAYLTAKREGRARPRALSRAMRRRLLDEVVVPYTEAKERDGVLDWNDIAVAARGVTDVPPWDVVIVDEAQDFSANQVRAVLAHLADSFSVTSSWTRCNGSTPGTSRGPRPASTGSPTCTR